MAFRRLHHAFKHLGSSATAALATGRRSRRRRTAAAALPPGAGRYQLERLENRVLLTTVTGFPTADNGGNGDVFEYRDELDQVIRVKLTGNINAELIGAQVDRRTNEISLVNLPGNLNGQPVFGGVAPGPGLQTIGDIILPTGFAPNISAIAAAGNGIVYAINTVNNFVNPLGQLGTGNQIIQLSIPLDGLGPVIGTVLGTIFTPDLSTNPGLPLLVMGADVSPGGLLFFTATTGNGTSRLFSVDPRVANPATFEDEVALSLNAAPNAFNLPPGPNMTGPPVESIAFGQNGTLFGIHAGTNLVTISPGSGDILTSVPIIDDDANDIGGIVGLEANPDTGDLLAIQSGDDAAVFDVFSTGLAFNLGPLGTIGASALAFVPGIQDPFTGGTTGAFIGVDNLTDTLFFVNPSDRLPAQFLWNVYVADSDLTGQIVIGYVRMLDEIPFPDPYVIRAFEGSIGTIRVRDANTGDLIQVGPSNETGRVFLGARSQDINPDIDNEDLIPYEIAPVPSAIDLGLLPDNVTSMRPGLIVEADADLGKFMLGGTFTGAVDARRNLDFFYAGWLLTGTLRGTSATGLGYDLADFPDNFKVAGDVRNVVVRSHIGSAGGLNLPNYVTGFDMQVGGTIGEISAGDFIGRDDPEFVAGLGVASAFHGTIEVNHLEDAPRIERNQFESEFHSADIRLGFEQFNFGGSPFTFNDNFNSAEFLGSIASADLGRSGVVRVNGTLQKTAADVLEDPRDVFFDGLGDRADFYAVALMAGQRYTARLETFDDFLGTLPPTVSNDVVKPLSLAVFDPDGRLVASDYNDTDMALTQGEYFSFVADRPGVYRFAVGGVFDAPDFFGDGPNVGIIDYTMTVLNVGDIALGGVVTGAAFYDLFDPLRDYDPGIEIFRGDLGAIKAFTTNILSDSDLSYVIENGNLRAVDGPNVGILTGGAFGSSPTVDIPEGGIGLVRGSPPRFQFDQLPLAEPDDEGGRTPSILGGILAFNLDNLTPIGGDIQLIDGPNSTVHVHLVTNRGIGVIRAGTLAADNDASILTVNADDTGEDGIIDLIDVFGDMGSISAGGPQITTNTGGNVRYIRVLRNIFRDVFFGGGAPDFILTSAGQDTTITDDSGARVNIRPIGDSRPNPDFDPSVPQSGFSEFIGPETQITTYGIRDAGGSAIVDITSDGGLEVSAQGGPAEIGRIEIRGIGIEVVNGPTVDDPENPAGFRETFVLDEGLPPDPDTGGGGNPDPGSLLDRRFRPEDLSLFLRGSSTVDVLNVVVANAGETDSADDENTNQLDDDGFFTGEIPGQAAENWVDLGNAVSIINETPGEIVNVMAESIGEIRANGSLGLARNHTGAALNGIEPLQMADTLRGVPGIGRLDREIQTGGRIVGEFGYFLGETNGIVVVGGNVGTLRAGRAIGNVVVQGSINEVVANADGVDDPNVFDGIVGVVSTYGFDDLEQSPETGRLITVNVGEGILPTGSGNFARAGVFAYNDITRVFANNADIRGDIQALNGVTIQGLQEVQTPLFDDDDVDNDNTDVDLAFSRGIGSVVVIDGSIINSDIIVTTDREDTEEFGAGFAIPGLLDPIDDPIYDIGRVSVRGNGGIIGSNIIASDIGSVRVEPGGFGIFTTDIEGLAFDRVNLVEAAGYGLRGMDIDPSGSLGNLIANGDGTSLSTNAINARVRFSENPDTDPLTGFLDPFFGTPTNRLTDIHEYLGTSREQPEISGVTDTGVIEAVDAQGQRDLGTVRAWQIRGGTTLDFANSFRTLDVRDIINGLEITTGTLRNFKLARDAFDLTVNVRGRVRNVDIRGSLAGGSVIRTVGDGGQFDNIKIAGNLIGNINSSRAIKSISIGGDFTGNVSVNSGGTAIKSMKVGGAFISGSLDVVGNIGTLQTKGSLGSIGDTLTINGSVKKIMVGGDLRSNVRVTGNLKNLTVKGSIVDGGRPNGLLIDVSDTLSVLNVGGDIQPGVTINALKFGKQRIGGQNAGSIVIQ